MSTLEARNDYRSKFEYLVAQNLIENGHCFDYEPKRIHYVSHHHYTPDFRVDGQDFYVECKGDSMSAEDRAKYQKASEQNEDLDLRFLFLTIGQSPRTAPPPSQCGLRGTASNIQLSQKCRHSG